MLPHDMQQKPSRCGAMLSAAIHGYTLFCTIPSPPSIIPLLAPCGRSNTYNYSEIAYFVPLHKRVSLGDEQGPCWGSGAKCILLVPHRPGAARARGRQDRGGGGVGFQVAADHSKHGALLISRVLFPSFVSPFVTSLN